MLELADQHPHIVERQVLSMVDKGTKQEQALRQRKQECREQLDKLQDLLLKLLQLPSDKRNPQTLQKIKLIRTQRLEESKLLDEQLEAAQEELQKEKVKKVEEERVKVKEMHDEEVVRAADRNVDLVYSSFKDDFNRMQGAITEGLSYCLTKSKGKLYPQVNEFQRQNDMICQSIAYTHKQGIGNELENSKRQEAYVEYKKQMEELVSRVAHLVGMAQQYY